jgi:hypothetical protein
MQHQVAQPVVIGIKAAHPPAVSGQTERDYYGLLETHRSDNSTCDKESY